MDHNVKDKVVRQYNAKFLEVVDYPEWLADIVAVSKEDRKVQNVHRFQDLNKASPKGFFPFRTWTCMLIMLLVMDIFLSTGLRVTTTLRWRLKTDN